MTDNRKNREFSGITKRLLGERVAYICSNPMCRRLTIKPHTTEKKSNRLGEAGHIHGASKKGPRFDPTKKDTFIRSYDNGVWLCNVCHKLVDSEKSTYDHLTLIKWKTDTENYIETLVIQDTRLRQLRLICQNYLTSLRILSALPLKLDQTFENPNGNNINLTRLFMELELLLFDNQFLEEADLIKLITLDLDKTICPFVHNNKTGNQLNISEWKNKAVKIFMVKIMRFLPESFERYLNQENSMVDQELNRLRATNIVPLTVDIKQTEIGKNNYP